jgi:acetyl esterase/lipase
MQPDNITDKPWLMKFLIVTYMLFVNMATSAQITFALYETDIPNSITKPNTEKSETWQGIQMVSNVSRPTITAYLPDKQNATGDAIIICPGGGYSKLAVAHEGEDVAKRLNELGIAAFVLKYRLPSSHWMKDPETGPIQDAQKAIVFVRQRAREWHLQPDRIGILGFSAGGHLASTAATHYKHSYLPRKMRGSKKLSLRPDFCILVYPVISFTDSIGHIGSRENLLGKNATAEKIRQYSNELHVTGKTPPTFLVHAKDDPVSYKNSLVFADALARHNVFSEVLFFESGGHGFGLVNQQSTISWLDRMADWLKRLPQ